MKSNIRILVITGLLFILSLNALGETGTKTGKQIEWLSFDKGIAALEADSTGKHMFIDFTASWCGWCKKMERETFADSTVINYVNANFIPVRVWGDSDKILEVQGYKISERNLATSEFRVSGYPCFYFLTPTKEKVGPLSGYQGSEKLIEALGRVNTREYEKQRATEPTPNEQTPENK
jgi:thioredoxin-related protein